jgi:TusA-related sulfurtransferase
LAKISYDLTKAGYSFPFLSVWNEQELANEMVTTIKMYAAKVQEVLTNAPSTHSNITEWAKQPACWSKVQETASQLTPQMLTLATSSSQRIKEHKEAAKDSELVQGIQAQTFVIEQGPEFWQEVLTWAQESQSISPKEASIVGICTRIPSKIPSEKQCEVALTVLERIKGEGFFFEVD